MYERVAIGFGFTLDWMSKWREIFNQSKRSIAKPKQKVLCYTVRVGQSGSESLRSCYSVAKGTRVGWRSGKCSFVRQIYYQYIISIVMLISTHANTFKPGFKL